MTASQGRAWHDHSYYDAVLDHNPSCKQPESWSLTVNGDYVGSTYSKPLADLLAAAPDLYAALVECVEALKDAYDDTDGSTRPWDRIIHAARTALARAEGRAV